MAVLACHI